MNGNNSLPSIARRPMEARLPDSDTSAGGYTLELFDSPVRSEYECPICLMCLRDAVQTEKCGHRFCKGCVIKAIENGRHECPVCKKYLSRNMLNPDIYARREIAKMKIRCCNLLCEWQGLLMELENHIKECSYQVISCKYECNRNGERRSIRKHEKEECPNRLVLCHRCCQQIVYTNSEEHIRNCTNDFLACPNACTSQLIPKDRLDEHLEFGCPKTVVKCPFTEIGCVFEGERDKLKEHVDKSMNQHLTELIAEVKKNSESVEVKVTPIRNLQNAGTPQLLQKIEELELEVKKLKEALVETKEKADQARSLAERYYIKLKALQTETGHEIQKLRNRWQMYDEILGELNAKVWRGKFVWRIGNFEGLFKQAMTGEVRALCSLPFYSDIPGYKMCLRVNLYGVDSGAGTHVSMFIHLMQGDFDSLVDWPFPGRIVLTVIDQSEAEQHHVSETLISRPGLQAFLRPRTPRNHKGYGYVEMISHRTLWSRGYIKNNTMVVQVEADLGIWQHPQL